MNRGDIATVDFSRYDPTDKVRPALILQNDRDNARMAKTIVAFITSNLQRSAEDTQYLISGAHPDFPNSGLRRDSVVNCSNLYTIRQADVTRIIGRLTRDTMKQIDACVKSSLDLQ
jgi:mRNA interferase MazF